MTTRYRTIEVSKKGVITEKSGSPVTCPIREQDCTIMCAWYSSDGIISRCRDTVIGSVSARKTIRSFRLQT